MCHRGHRGVAAGRSGVEVASAKVAHIATAAANSAWSATCTAGFAIWSTVRAAASAIAEKLPTVPRPNFRISSSRLGSALRIGERLPDVGLRLRIDPRLIAGGCGALALILIGGPMLQVTNGVSVAALVPSLPGSATALSGRGDAMSGDLLRVDGQLVRLTGIETPEPKQICLKNNGRRWSCGVSAKSALDKLVRGKTISCATSGQDDAGHTLATCRTKDADIATELVRGGHVFSAQGVLNSYNVVEDEARTAKLGVWQGESVRPQEWRDRVWEEAKRTAPEGCPIKGYVRADDRTYAMPWSAGYDGGKIRTVKGDRWFCSEEEARAAGFKLGSRS